MVSHFNSNLKPCAVDRHLDANDKLAIMTANRQINQMLYPNLKFEQFFSNARQNIETQIRRRERKINLRRSWNNIVFVSCQVYAVIVWQLNVWHNLFVWFDLLSRSVALIHWANFRAEKRHVSHWKSMKIFAGIRNSRHRVRCTKIVRQS